MLQWPSPRPIGLSLDPGLNAARSRPTSTRDYLQAGPTHDCDVTIEVRAHDTRTGHGPGVDHVLAGMTLPVVHPDADDRDPRPYRGEKHHDAES